MADKPDLDPNALGEELLARLPKGVDVIMFVVQSTPTPTPGEVAHITILLASLPPPAVAQILMDWIERYAASPDETQH